MIRGRVYASRTYLPYAQGRAGTVRLSFRTYPALCLPIIKTL